MWWRQDSEKATSTAAMEASGAWRVAGDERWVVRGGWWGEEMTDRGGREGDRGRREGEGKIEETAEEAGHALAAITGLCLARPWWRWSARAPAVLMGREDEPRFPDGPHAHSSPLTPLPSASTAAAAAATRISSGAAGADAGAAGGGGGRRGLRRRGETTRVSREAV